MSAQAVKQAQAEAQATNAINVLGKKQLGWRQGKFIPFPITKTVAEIKKEHKLLTASLRRSNNSFIDNAETNDLHAIIERFNKAYVAKQAKYAKAASRNDAVKNDEHAVRYAKSVYYTKKDNSGALAYKDSPTEFERLCKYIETPIELDSMREQAGVFSPLADLWRMENGQFVKNDGLFDKNSEVVVMRDYIARQFAERNNASGK